MALDCFFGVGSGEVDASGVGGVHGSFLSLSLGMGEGVDVRLEEVSVDHVNCLGVDVVGVGVGVFVDAR